MYEYGHCWYRVSSMRYEYLASGKWKCIGTVLAFEQGRRIHMSTHHTQDPVTLLILCLIYIQAKRIAA